jgi:D-glycerate 3-kinase
VTQDFERATAFAQSDSLLVSAIMATRQQAGRPIVVGLCGAQGSGKSTTAMRLAAQLGEAGEPTAVLSIDDFYLTLAQRRALARDVHPLFITRGVPGTHDVALAQSTITALLHAGKGETVAAPCFDKTIDDRAPPEHWPLHAGPISVVLLEGWCVGAGPQDSGALTAPINALERDEDVDGQWRRYVNDQLAGAYADLFSRLDLRLFLKPPNFGLVAGWRREQEAGLKRVAGYSQPAMSEAALLRFIAHYERITRSLIDGQWADISIEIDADRVPLRHTLPPLGPKPKGH